MLIHKSKRTSFGFAMTGPKKVPKELDLFLVFFFLEVWLFPQVPSPPLSLPQNFKTKDCKNRSAVPWGKHLGRHQNWGTHPLSPVGFVL